MPSDVQRAYARRYLREVAEIAGRLDIEQVLRVSDILRCVREERGRLFILGVGGSAGNASHAVNDFRKIAGIDASAPTDNVSELTARINDDGWDTAYANWLRVSSLSPSDAVLILSVGGGSVEKKVSANLVYAAKYAKEVGASVIGIVGRDGGETAKLADAYVLIPTISGDTITPHAEAFQAVLWHLWATGPDLKAT